MSMDEVRIFPVIGLPYINPGDDLPAILIAAIHHANQSLEERDVAVIAQKIVSKAEGRIVKLAEVRPSAFARNWAEAYGKDARVVEVALAESKRIVKMDRGVLISETRHGFICANAGVDTSNVAEGTVTLLPEDPDGSALGLRQALEAVFRVNLAVIISDTFGRPWREGLVNVAVGVSGMAPVVDYRGRQDWLGNTLRVTTVSIADEIASAAELVMTKDAGRPAAIVRGAHYETEESNNLKLVRSAALDLFR